MADILINDKHLDRIADAIRYVNKSTTQYRPREMASAIFLLNVPTLTDSENIRAYLETDTETSVTMNNVVLRNHYFSNNTIVQHANFPNLKLIPRHIFNACDSVTTTRFPVATRVGEYAFYGCDNLTTIDIGGNLETIDIYAFAYCKGLAALILRGNSVPTLDYYVFYNSSVASGTGYVYVPSVLLDAYKTAPIWSDYANQIRAIEDYPDVC